MNTKLIRNLSIIGAVFIVFFGSALHFVYDWTGHNYIVGFFAPVNESVWEHMKLAFTPLLLFTFVEYTYYGRKIHNFDFVRVIEMLFPIVFIILFFYIYRMFTGESLFLDILSFILAVVFAKMIGYKIIKSKFSFAGGEILSALLIVCLAIFFAIATVNPPKNNIFLDPVTDTYGINQLE